MAYEDITLTTSDNLAIKAYMIPARRNVKSREEMMGLSASQREEVGKEALEEWVKEMGEDDAFEVGFYPFRGFVTDHRFLTPFTHSFGMCTCADLTVCKVSTHRSDLSRQCRYVHSYPSTTRTHARVSLDHG
jgi:hypothetical protein